MDLRNDIGEMMQKVENTILNVIYCLNRGISMILRIHLTVNWWKKTYKFDEKIIMQLS